MRTIRSSEYSTILYWSTARSTSGSTVRRIAASITPGVLPMPPRITMTTISMLFVKSNPVGVMVSLKCP